MVAFPPPPVTLRQRSSTFVEPLCSLRRVLASGCHSFLFEWLEKVSQPSLAKPFGFDQGVNRINSRLSLLSFGRHRTDCRSLVRSRRPQPSRQGVYTPTGFLEQLFLCFISTMIFYFLIFLSAATILLCTAFISSSPLYFVRGQKKPFKPSFFRRGTTCTCKCGTL